ncbi:response regulator transcription factor [Paenibacillus alkaliterrae]|nr:response regulator transcription factor [Paenibacillus alkaliterrae]MCF2941248.1 response regulator transcription factor [Paenibacillus alkaliterrae]
MTTFEYCRVLIVDDEVLIRQGIKHFMNWEQEGFHIVGEASNGEEALELIAELKPHIVITDIVMPVMDGEELTKLIKLHHPDIEVIVLSSFGEFDYVRSTFQSGVADYILKPKLDLQHLLTVLKVTADKIPSLRAKEAAGGYRLSMEKIFEKMLSGYEVEYDAKDVAAVFPHRYFCLVGAGLRGRKNQAKHRLDSLKQKIEAEINTRLTDAACRLLPTDSHIRAVLLNVDQNGLAALPGWAKDTAELIESPDDIVFVVSEPFTDFAQTGHMYKESLLRLLDYSFYFPGKRLLIYNELPSPMPIADTFHLNRFTEEIKRERFESAFRYLREHVEALAAGYTTDVFEFKSFLGNLIFNITVLLGNMEYGTKELEKNKYTYFKAIEESRHVHEAVARLDEFIAEADKCIAGKAAQPGNANMKKLLEYIDEHYAEPLNLTEMAKHFHFNPSYLSSYFTSHNNEGFIEYLHRVRTEKAAELLRKGEATISEISGLVGYSEHSYFCKVFKKHTGISPSRYRRQYMK